MGKIALFFDLDGTLWDVTKITHDASIMVSNRYHYKSPSYNDILSGMGQTKNYCAKLYYPFLSIKESGKLLREIASLVAEKIINKDANIYPNVNETLKKLSSNYDLYIISNTSNSDYASAIEIYVDVKFKEKLACGSINLKKSEGIKYIMSKNNIKNAIYIGDTNLDKQSANNAGIPFIYCKYGFGNMKKNKYEIHNFNELETVIKKINFTN